MCRCALRAIVRLRGTERIAVSILLLNERAVRKVLKNLHLPLKFITFALQYGNRC